MRTFIIGSSNTSRFMHLLNEYERSVMDIQKCTKFESFEAQMNELDETEPIVQITVIENFVCDAVREEVGKDRVKNGIDKALTAFLAVIKATAVRLPGSKFVAVEPMSRPAVEWYMDNLDDFTKKYSDGLSGLQLANISIIKRFDLPSQMFGDDFIHLTESAGAQFLRAIIYFAERIFEATVVDLSEEAMETTAGGSEQTPTNKDTPTARAPGYISVPAEVEKTLEEQLAELKARMEERWHNASLVFARVRDEMDALLNAKKEDRVVITGLRTDEAKPSGQVEARQWLNGLIHSALDSLIPESSQKIKFINPGKNFSGEIPVCEVGFKEADLAGKLRKEFGNRRKGGIDTGKFFLANSVTLGTRVRLEILRAIARKCSNASEDFFAIGFTSRPVLQVRQKSGGGQYAMTFVDAVVKYGGRVGESDLRLAYDRAGVTFRGQMQQNFVVLTEKGVRIGGGNAARGRGGSGRPRGNDRGRGKRPLEGDRKEENMSKKPAGRGGMGRGTPGN